MGRNEINKEGNWTLNRKCKECGNPISNDDIFDICGDCKHRKIKQFKPKYGS